MLSAKPMASLNAGLLARKGQARPAMRRHGMAGLAALSDAGDDLGWNDMGDAAITPTPVEPLPLVLEERAQLAAAFAAPAVDENPLPTVANGRKAAFTLRLDTERHLRLRLASAARGASAQVLLTEALDALIAAMPEVEALRGQLPGDARRPSR